MNLGFGAESSDLPAIDGSDYRDESIQIFGSFVQAARARRSPVVIYPRFDEAPDYVPGGNCDTSQPPPTAWTSATLATKRRVSKSTAVRCAFRSVACSLITVK